MVKYHMPITIIKFKIVFLPENENVNIFHFFEFLFNLQNNINEL